MQVERPPATCRDFSIGLALDERRRKKVRGLAFSKIVQRSENIVIREMNQAISAKDEIRFRQGMSGYVEGHEPSSGFAKFLNVFLNQF